MRATGIAIRQKRRVEPGRHPENRDEHRDRHRVQGDFDEHGDRGVEPERIGHCDVGVLCIAEDEVCADRCRSEQRDGPGDDRDDVPPRAGAEHCEVRGPLQIRHRDDADDGHAGHHSDRVQPTEESARTPTDRPAPAMPSRRPPRRSSPETGPYPSNRVSTSPHQVDQRECPLTRAEGPTVTKPRPRSDGPRAFVDGYVMMAVEPLAPRSTSSPPAVESTASRSQPAGGRRLG